MLQQARTKRLHWWLMESRLDQNGRQIQKARSEITCAWHFKYVVVVVEWWTLSCIEIRRLSSPPNPFSLNPSFWEEVEEKYQNQARAFFTIIFSTILHGSSPPTYKCRFILTRHNAFNSDKLSSVTVDGSFTAIYSRRSVVVIWWLAPWKSVPTLFIFTRTKRFSTQCVLQISRRARRLSEHQYCGFPVSRTRVARQEIRSDEIRSPVCKPHCE